MTLPLALLGLLALLPVVLVAYFAAVITLGSRLVGYQYRDAHRYALYLPFVGGACLLFFLVTPVTVDVRLASAHLPFLALGGVLYYADTHLWSTWTGQAVEPGQVDGVWLLPTIVGATVEELLYRGWLGLLVDSIGGLGFVVVSAALFGINHAYEGRNEVVLKTVDGGIYALVYLLAGSIAAPVLAHVGYNAAFVHFVWNGSGRRDPVTVD